MSCLTDIATPTNVAAMIFHCEGRDLLGDPRRTARRHVRRVAQAMRTGASHSSIQEAFRSRRGGMRKYLYFG